MEKLIRKITNSIIIAIAGGAGLCGLYVVFACGDIRRGDPTPLSMDMAFFLTYVLIFTGAALVLVFGIMQIVASKRRIIGTLIIAVIAVLTFLICYWVAPTEMSEVAIRMDMTESTYKWVGASLNLAYVMVAALVLTFIGMQIYIKIKDR